MGSKKIEFFPALKFRSKILGKETKFFWSEFHSKAFREESCFATNEDLSTRSITLAKHVSKVIWQHQLFVV